MNDIHLHRLDLNSLFIFYALMAEGSVVRAAEQLNKAPSAVSHALARLRDQVGVPLMVKVGGKMQPSPFAETLIEDVRPILPPASASSASSCPQYLRSSPRCARLSQDPGGKRLRSIVIGAYETIHDKSLQQGMTSG